MPKVRATPSYDWYEHRHAELERLLAIVLRVTGHSRAYVLGRNRHQDAIDARCAFVILVRRFLPVSQQSIISFLRRDYSTLLVYDRLILAGRGKEIADKATTLAMRPYQRVPS